MISFSRTMSVTLNFLICFEKPRIFRDPELARSVTKVPQTSRLLQICFFLLNDPHEFFISIQCSQHMFLVIALFIALDFTFRSMFFGKKAIDSFQVPLDIITQARWWTEPEALCSGRSRDKVRMLWLLYTVIVRHLCPL